MTEIGLGLFTTGLICYVGQRDVNEEHLRRISEVIAGEPAARPDGLVALVSSETRDRIVENCPRGSMRAMTRSEIGGNETRHHTDCGVNARPRRG